MIQALMGKLRSSGFRGINLDLIYGLPRQTVAGFERTIEAVLTLRPDRISLFHFAYLPELKQHQRLIDPAGLPDACERVKILTGAIEQLSAGGYVHIGMDHFALPGDELELAQREGRLHRNFQGYTTRGDCDLLGFGVSSIGDPGNAYVQNTRNMTNYVNALERNTLPVERGYLLTPEDEERRGIIRQLICHFTLEYDADFRRRYAAEFENLREFEADDLLVIEPRPGADHLEAEDTGGGCIKVTPAGKFVIRNICMVFDAYVTDLRARGQRFSRSI
jgi:oxygen-independent coproporphyrinogen-3 oxidase